MTATVAPAFLRSTVGKKVVMAVTGIILFGFTLSHMIGNLQLYQGPEALNHYAKLLRAVPSLLWGARIVLIVSVIAHIVVATQLTLRKREARPVAYAMHDFQRGTYASRTMMWSGPILAFFLIYHLLHLTFGTAHPNFEEGNVYANVVSGFQNVPASVAYILGMLALGFHLQHGAISLFQTLGLKDTRWNGRLETIVMILTYAVVVANISFPIAVLVGVVK